MMIELIRSCDCGDNRLALDKPPGPCFNIFTRDNEIYIVTIPHTELCSQDFPLHCPKCHGSNFALISARNKPMHPIKRS